jgi:hypothetical protein
MKKSKKVSKVMKEFKAGKLKSGKSDKKVTNPKQAIAIALSEAGMSKNKKIKAREGMMIEEAQSPSLMGGLGAAAAPEAMGSEGMSSDDRFSEIDLDYAEKVARRVPPMKEKSITPKERREKDIAKRAKKKMGGGMMSDGVSRKGMGIEKRMGGGMMSDGIANRGSGIEMKSKGGMVRGQGIAIRGTRFKGIF